jgi:hypothetical protein
MAAHPRMSNHIDADAAPRARATEHGRLAEHRRAQLADRPGVSATAARGIASRLERPCSGQKSPAAVSRGVAWWRLS